MCRMIGGSSHRTLNAIGRTSQNATVGEDLVADRPERLVSVARPRQALMRRMGAPPAGAPRWRITTGSA